MTTEGIAPLTEVERDALCELANIAMARAASSLRKMVGRPILLSVPKCEILGPEAAVKRLAEPGNPNLVAVRQDFSGAFSGRALLIFPEIGSLELMRAILGRQTRYGYVALMMDLPSIEQLRSLIAAFLKSLNAETG
jgi:chemotaxis protein CheC